MIPGDSFKSILINPLLILGVIGILLLLEPDFGATAVSMLTALGMIFLAGGRLWQFLVLAMLIGAILVLLAIFSPYRSAL